MRPCQPGCQRAEHGDSQKGDFGFGQHLGVSCNEVRVSPPMQETRSHAISFTEFTARCSNGGNGWLRFDKRRRRGFLIKRRHHVGSYLAGIKSQVSPFSLNEGAPSRELITAAEKAWSSWRARFPRRVPTPGRRKTGSGWPSDNRTWGQCLRRHDLNSVFDSAKIRWIDIIVNRRYQKCCPIP
jgi:hypothetical protein